MATLTERLKSSKQILGEKIPCTVEALSPIHIGSGVKLAEGWDFVYSQSSKTLKIVSQDDILPTLSEKKLNEFNDDSRRRDILSKAESKRSYTLNYQRGQVLEFERNGNGTPYIPGSSFKGAVRTALFVADYVKNKPSFENLLKNINKNDEIKPERASDSILEKAFGNNPNHNQMRLLIPSDIHFSQDAVEVSEVKILSLSNREATSFSYKNFSLYPEHLKIGTKGNFSLRIDEFLFKNTDAKKELGFSPLSFSNIAKAVNEQSKKYLENEIAFFEKCGKDSLKEVIDFNKALLAEIKTDSNDEFMLRLSWGSGWKGMTGDYLDDNWIKIFRAKFNLGKKGFPIFPKSRRILFKNGKPRFTFGWVHVKINHSFSENELSNSNLSIQRIQEIVQPKVIKQKPQGTVEAIVVSTDPPKAKVKILEGKHKDAVSDLNIPLSNLANLGIEKGRELYVNLVEQGNKIQSVQFRSLK